MSLGSAVCSVQLICTVTVKVSGQGVIYQRCLKTMGLEVFDEVKSKFTICEVAPLQMIRSLLMIL